VADRTLAWSHAVDDAVAAVDADAGEWPVCRSPRRRNSVCGTSETSEDQIKYPFRNCHLGARVTRARARHAERSGNAKWESNLSESTTKKRRKKEKGTLPIGRGLGRRSPFALPYREFLLDS